MNPARWNAAGRLIGLGMRARTVVVGVTGVRSAASKGTLRLAVIASDAAGNSVDKVVPLLRAKGVTYLVGPSAQQLGDMVGRSPVAALGVIDSQLAAGITGALSSAS